MTYKILHWLFAWDYIVWSKQIDQGIARVHIDGEGKPWYWRYKSTRLADRILRADQVIWLTCHPSKYLCEKKGEK